MAEKTKILIIDDEQIIRASFRCFLEDRGYIITEGQNGEEGLKLFHTLHPDLVLVDLIMPGTSGLQVIEEINKTTPYIPVIVISGTGVIKDAVNALRLGAWDYIFKPVSQLEELELVIKRGLEKKKLLLANKEYEENLEKQVTIRTEELEQLLYAASHDLRSPLVNIHGYCGELQRSLDVLRENLKDLPDKYKTKQEEILEMEIPEAFHFITQSVKKMDSLLEGLLKIFHLQKGTLNLETVNMDHFFTDLLDSFRFKLNKENITIHLKPLPPCQADRTFLLHIFSNLLDNAIKYRHPAKKGLIQISGTREGEKSTYRLEDNGLGIRSEFKKKIFDLFYRGHPEYGEGVGIGMATVKKCIIILGGKIRVESEPGKGTIFFVTI